MLPPCLPLNLAVKKYLRLVNERSDNVCVFAQKNDMKNETMKGRRRNFCARSVLDEEVNRL